jgi:hypothetical protein
VLPQVGSPEDVANLVQIEMAALEREQLRAVLLATTHRAWRKRTRHVLFGRGHSAQNSRATASRRGQARQGAEHRPLVSAFVDHVVAEHFILLGGPLPDKGGAALVVHAGSEAEVRKRLGLDPWYEHGILALERVRRWDIFVDRWIAAGAKG